jgi:hypothetical protein
MQLSKELSHLVWGLEVAIFLKIVKGHEPFHRLVPLAIVFITGLRIPAVEERHDEGMENTNVSRFTIRLELLDQIAGPHTVPIRQGKLVGRRITFKRKKDGQGELMETVPIDLIGSLILEWTIVVRLARISRHKSSKRTMNEP